MSFRGIATALVGLSLVATPIVAAEAAPTASVNSSTRSGVVTSNPSELAGGGWLIAIPAFVAAAAGVYFATKSHKKKAVSS